MVMDGHTFSSSKHLTKYCADDLCILDVSIVGVA